VRQKPVLLKPGIAKAGAKVSRSVITKAPIKSLGGLTISPSFQKNESKTYDNSTNSTVNYNN